MEVILHESLPIDPAALHIHLCQISQVCCQNEIPLLIMGGKKRIERSGDGRSLVVVKPDIPLELEGAAVEAVEIWPADVRGIIICKEDPEIVIIVVNVKP
jgi:hypothetical protein